MQVSAHSLVKFLVLYFSAENISNFCTIIFSQYWLEYRNTSKCNKSHRFLGLINRCISNDTAKALVSPFLFYSCSKCAVCVAKTRLYIRSRYNHCVLKTFHSLNIKYHFYNHYLKNSEILVVCTSANNKHQLQIMTLVFLALKYEQ